MHLTDHRGQHDWHVRYTRYLQRILTMSIACFTMEELADSEAVERWMGAELERCWAAEKSLQC